MTDVLRQIFYDPETGLQGADELYRRAKKQDPTIKMKDFQVWLKM
ncbi:MAG: hypothetical protein P4L81_07595 [Candidatus Pacebacteria bacterium]|nr:hypothetical protein [Candidatus Paceibacterota bacterium]